MKRKPAIIETVRIKYPIILIGIAFNYLSISLCGELCSRDAVENLNGIHYLNMGHV